MNADSQAIDAALAAGARICRSGDWLSEAVGAELVMMNVATGHYIGVSETGGRTWELLATPLTMAALCARLSEEYEASAEDIAPDVRAFLHGMIAHGAVSLDPPPVAA